MNKNAQNCVAHFSANRHVNGLKVETYGEVNLVGMYSHPINANRLRCNKKSEPIWVLLIQSDPVRKLSLRFNTISPMRTCARAYARVSANNSEMLSL